MGQISYRLKQKALILRLFPVDLDAPHMDLCKNILKINKIQI